MAGMHSRCWGNVQNYEAVENELFLSQAAFVYRAPLLSSSNK